MIDITVTSLVKSFEIGNNILDGLSFQVEAGERVGILGPNGCGKTTLFRILTGALDYDEGQVSIAPSKRLGLISQLPVYPEGWTAEDVPPCRRRPGTDGKTDGTDGTRQFPRPARGVRPPRCGL